MIKGLRNIAPYVPGAQPQEKSIQMRMPFHRVQES